jgi:hypothetical protein
MDTCELEIDIDLDGQAMARRYSGVSVSIVRITAEIAREMLEKNTKNRPLNKRHADRLKDAMIAGEWWMNGETIIFSAEGILLNGQHRLWAIVASGVSVDVLVVRGIDAEAFRTLDGVRTRRTGEVLGMAGEVNASSLASCVQALLTFVHAGGSIWNGSTHAGPKATPSTCERILRAHPGIRESVCKMRRNALFHNQHATMLHYLFSCVSQPIATDFANVLADGDSDIGRPFVVLRESLLRVPHRTDLRKAYCAKAIKAFNAELSGDRPKMFRFSADEDFPTIDGFDYEKLAESINGR